MIHCSIEQTVAKAGISQKKIREAALGTIRAAKRSTGHLTVHFVGTRAMRRLNRIYRGLDRPTDVLSFSMHEGVLVPASESAYDQLGDVFLCPLYIKKQARRFGVSYNEECVRMLVHGVLHILGYDHTLRKDADTMFHIQEKVVSQSIP